MNEYLLAEENEKCPFCTGYLVQKSNKFKDRDTFRCLNCWSRYSRVNRYETVKGRIIDVERLE